MTARARKPASNGTARPRFRGGTPPWIGMPVIGSTAGWCPGYGDAPNAPVAYPGPADPGGAYAEPGWAGCACVDWSAAGPPGYPAPSGDPWCAMVFPPARTPGLPRRVVRAGPTSVEPPVGSCGWGRASADGERVARDLD